MSNRRPAITLHLLGPAHVTVDGRKVRLARKGLALLCYLALERTAARERLASLLWGHRQAMTNLRVEIHRLRSAFAPWNVDPFEGSTDPLTLTRVIHVQAGSGAGELMEGLDDVSTSYQDWLEYRRAAWSTDGGRSVRTALVDELAADVAPPYVIVLEGAPGSGRRDLAQALARRLDLPFLVGADAMAGEAAVRHVDPAACDNDKVAVRVSNDDENVWVITRSTFGEDPALVIRLRAMIPPERLRFVRLPPLTWNEARATMPEDLAFDEAARWYLVSGGNPGYLGELAKLRARMGDARELPVPQRLRAMYALEARRLGEGARSALERLSVHDGVFTPTLLETLRADAHVDELERHGWLRYENGVWRYPDPVIPRLIGAEIRDGQRMRLLRDIRSTIQLEQQADNGAVTTTRKKGRREPTTTGRISPLPIVRVHRGGEHWLDDGVPEGSVAHLDGTTATWAHHGDVVQEHVIVWELPQEPLLLWLKGRVVVVDSHSGPSPRSLLRFTLTGVDAPELELVEPGQRTEIGSNGSLPGRIHLEAAETFDHWLLVPPAKRLRVASAARALVAEVTLRAYRVACPVRGGGTPVAAVAWHATVLDDPVEFVTPALDASGMGIG